MAGRRELGEAVFVAVRNWADPRERALRKRRRARRRSIRYGAATGVTAIGTVGLIAAAAPVWVVAITAGGAAVLVVPATVAVRKYRRLHDVPLPAPAAPYRPLPPMGSRARAPMLALERAERGLDELFDVIARSASVPADELAETVATARSAAAAVQALSVDVVGLERARSRAGTVGKDVAEDLDAAIRAAVTQLEAGVADYQQLLRAAARMVTPTAATQSPASERAATDLRAAADRLDGWAEALVELADRSAAPTPHRTRSRVRRHAAEASG